MRFGNPEEFYFFARILMALSRLARPSYSYQNSSSGLVLPVRESSGSVAHTLGVFYFVLPWNDIDRDIYMGIKRKLSVLSHVHL